MKNFLRAAFNISLFQIFLIIALGILKYFVVKIGLMKMLQIPFIIALITFVFLLIIATGITEYLENKGITIESCEDEYAHSKAHNLFIIFLKWARIIPVVLGYIFFIYIITPTTFSLFLIFLAGIVIRNVIGFLYKKERILSEETS